MNPTCKRTPPKGALNRAAKPTASRSTNLKPTAKAKCGSIPIPGQSSERVTQNADSQQRIKTSSRGNRSVLHSSMCPRSIKLQLIHQPTNYMAHQWALYLFFFDKYFQQKPSTIFFEILQIPLHARQLHHQ